MRHGGLYVLALEGGIAYLRWIALRLTCPADKELLAEPKQKFLGTFDVDAAPGQWQKARWRRSSSDHRGHWSSHHLTDWLCDHITNSHDH